MRLSAFLRTIGALVYAACVCTTAGLGAITRLSQQQAKVLVLAVPDAVAVRATGGCPKSDVSNLGPDFVMVQLRNSCPSSGSGLIGNYVVSLKSGSIWSDIDRQHTVRSSALSKLRRKLRFKQGAIGGKPKRQAELDSKRSI